MTQHDEIMSALFEAKERNSDEAKIAYSNIICEIHHNELRTEKCNLKDAVMKLNYNYYFEENELSRVINLINNIKCKTEQ